MMLSYTALLSYTIRMSVKIKHSRNKHTISLYEEHMVHKMLYKYKSPPPLIIIVTMGDVNHTQKLSQKSTYTQGFIKPLYNVIVFPQVDGVLP